MKKIFIPQAFVIVFSAIMILTTGCKKESNSRSGNSTSSVAKTPGSTTINSPYFFTGLLGGQPITLSGTPTFYNRSLESNNDSLNMWYSCGGNPGNASSQAPGSGSYGNNGPGQSANNSGTVYITGTKWTKGGSSSDSSIIQGSVELRQLSIRVYVAPVAQQPGSIYYSILKPSTNYPYLSQDSLLNGVLITLRDNTGTLWTSNGDQTGSSFQITSVGSEQEQYTTVSGIVTAKLYNSTGKSVTLTSAAFTTLVGL